MGNGASPPESVTSFCPDNLCVLPRSHFKILCASLCPDNFLVAGFCLDNFVHFPNLCLRPVPRNRVPLAKSVPGGLSNRCLVVFLWCHVKFRFGPAFRRRNWCLASCQVVHFFVVVWVWFFGLFFPLYIDWCCVCSSVKPLLAGRRSASRVVQR